MLNNCTCLLCCCMQPVLVIGLDQDDHVLREAIVCGKVQQEVEARGWAFHIKVFDSAGKP